MSHMLDCFKSKISPYSRRDSFTAQQYLQVPTENQELRARMGHRHSRIKAGPATSHSHFIMPSYQPNPVQPFVSGVKGVSYINNTNAECPPPPYIHQASNSTTSVASDSAYAFLQKFDTIFIVDDSSSMYGIRWKEAGEAIAAIAPICTQYDQDGIDIHFLNKETTYRKIRTAEDVQEIFHNVEPRGGTYFGIKLDEILDPYLDRVEEMKRKGKLKSVKPINIIAITDGEFSDDVETVLSTAARRLDNCHAVPWQVGVQFFQIGDDKRATQRLKELDDDLGRSRKEGMRDIIDTVPWEGKQGERLSADRILKVTLGAVIKRLDKQA